MRTRRRLRPRQFIAEVVALTVLVIAGICTLPHDRYVRFKSLRDNAVIKAGWIYERIHFDPTPIDVVFVGSSHTVFGVDSARVESQYLATTGRDLHIVNLAMPHLGRDLQYVLAREVLQTRSVKLLVIEVQEDESRSLHPAFASLAESGDIITAPLLINTNFFDNLAHLPMRQLRLFIHSIAPGLFGESIDFDPATYPGAHWDDTYQEHPAADARTVAPPRLESHSAEQLEQERQHLDRMIASKLMLPDALKGLETRANLNYLHRMLDVAGQARVPVRFLYMPDYAAHVLPRFQSVYQAYGPLWYPQDVYRHLAWWLDVGHLNNYGAEALSDWLAKALSNEPASLAALPAVGGQENCKYKQACGQRLP